MNAVEKIEAAIQKLEDLKSRSGAYSEWFGGDFQRVSFLEHDVNMVGGLAVEMWDGSGQNALGEWHDSAAVELVTVLHRTVDAQLKFLRFALAEYRGWYGAGGYEDGDGEPEPFFTHAISLADAILGGTA